MKKITGNYSNAGKRPANALKMLYVNPYTRTVSTEYVENDLEAYYKLLNCSCITITSMNIRGKYFDIICDDEALLKDEPRLSMVDLRGRPALFGCLLVCLHDREGNTVGITDDDVKRIKSDLVTLIGVDGTTPALRGDY